MRLDLFDNGLFISLRYVLAVSNRGLLLDIRVLDWWLLHVLDILRLLLDILNGLYWGLLLHVLDLLNRLLDYALNDFGLGLVHNLAFNCLVLNSFHYLFLGQILDVAVLVHLGHVFGLVLDGIVVCHLLLLCYIFGALDWFVFDLYLLVRYVFNARLASHGLVDCVSINSCASQELGSANTGCLLNGSSASNNRTSSREGLADNLLSASLGFLHWNVRVRLVRSV